MLNCYTLFTLHICPVPFHQAPSLTACCIPWEAWGDCTVLPSNDSSCGHC